MARFKLRRGVMTRISDREFVIGHGRHARGRGRWAMRVTYFFSQCGQRGKHEKIAKIFAPSNLTLTEAVRHIEKEWVAKELAIYNNNSKLPQIYAVNIDIPS